MVNVKEKGNSKRDIEEAVNRMRKKYTANNSKYL